MKKVKNININKLEDGDIVNVDFNNSQHTLCSKAILLYRPSQGNDSWIFKDTKTKKLYYVSEGCTVSLIEKGFHEEYENDDLPF